MNIWIYDENSYPSGFAGGWVPEPMPESRGHGAGLPRGEEPRQAGRQDLVAVYRLHGRRLRERDRRSAKRARPLPEGRYLSPRSSAPATRPGTATGVTWTCSLPGVTEKFLEVTLEAYRREIGDQFGKRVPGVFTDEPNIRPAGGLPWTDDLPAAVPEALGLRSARTTCRASTGRWATGSGAAQLLPGAARAVHRALGQAVLRLLRAATAWSSPATTGTTSGRECVGVPDNMAMYAWQQRPGIDCLMNQYARGHPRPVRQRADGAARSPASPTSWAASGRCARSTAPAAGTCVSRT